MAARKASARKAGAHKSAKGKPRGKGKPFQPGNPWRIKPGEIRNPGGRPKLISEAYREWLEFVDEDGVSNAAKLAMAQGTKAVKGDTPAAREIRQTTEGDKLTLDLSRLTDDQLARLARGEDVRSVLANPGDGGAGAAPPAPGDGDRPR